MQVSVRRIERVRDGAGIGAGAGGEQPGGSAGASDGALPVHNTCLL